MKNIILLVISLISSACIAQAEQKPDNSTVEKTPPINLDKTKLLSGKNEVFTSSDKSYYIIAVVSKELMITSLNVENSSHSSIASTNRNYSIAKSKTKINNGMPEGWVEHCFVVNGKLECVCIYLPGINKK